MADDDKRSENDGREGLIGVITNHWRLLALVVIVTEGLLATLALKADRGAAPWMFVVMAAILVVVVLGVVILARVPRGSIAVPQIGQAESARKRFTYDVFLAAPMAAQPSDPAYQKSRLQMLAIKQALIEQCGFRSVFYAADTIDSIEKFQDEALAVKDDLEAIRDSRYFVLVYPERLVSSVLLEAGAALALGKPSLYFGPRQNFPFLMKAADRGFRHVVIHEDPTPEDVVKRIVINKSRLFEFGAAPAA